MQYIEDENGNIINGYRATAIRQSAHRAFQQIKSIHGLPKTWGVANTSVVRAFTSEMAIQVPEMRYCSENWKALYLATQIYPSWYQSHGNGKPKQEAEECMTGKRIRAEEQRPEPRKEVKPRDGAEAPKQR